MPAHLLRMPGLVVLVALVYVATGWPSMQVSIPPHHVAGVHPGRAGAGAVLVRGLGRCPACGWGRWVCSGWPATGAGWGFQWVWLAAPCGAVLQAAGGVGHRRWVGIPVSSTCRGASCCFSGAAAVHARLNRQPVGAPCCWIEVIPRRSLVHLVVVVAGRMPWGRCCSPLVLVGWPVCPCVAQPLETVALPSMAAPGVVAVAFVQIQDSERRVLTQRFEQESAALTERLQRRLHAQTDALLAVTRLMEISSRDDPVEFRLSTEVWLNRQCVERRTSAGAPTSPMHSGRAFERQASQMHQEPYQIRARCRLANLCGRRGRELSAHSVCGAAGQQPGCAGAGRAGAACHGSRGRATVASGLPQVTEGIPAGAGKG